MADKKIWFTGYTSRLWIPISVEGWLVTLAFFGGMFLIAGINNAQGNGALTISQILLIVLEIAVLLGLLRMVTKGHVDKRY